MRVIAGSAKGTRLVAVPRGVRPVSDRAREGLFSSLGAEVHVARVLDLFAGTGAMGIEALSRGAAAATFVDRDPAAVAAIRGNLERSHLGDRASVVRAEAERFLARTSGPDPVAVCLLDPPYATPSSELEGLLAGLGGGWLDPAGWVVALTRPKRSSTLVIPVNWRVAKRLEYGDSHFVIYRED